MFILCCTRLITSLLDFLCCKYLKNNKLTLTLIYLVFQQTVNKNQSTQINFKFSVYFIHLLVFRYRNYHALRPNFTTAKLLEKQNIKKCAKSNLRSQSNIFSKDDNASIQCNISLGTFITSYKEYLNKNNLIVLKTSEQLLNKTRSYSHAS